MPYTNVAKPTSTTYTKVIDTQGLEIYDQIDVSYDDISVYYDGVNQSQYINIAKPDTGDTWAEATYSWSSETSPWGSPTYTMINKPV